MICENLTDIEQMLLDALRTGASNKEIANRMSKSEQTVRNQLTKLFRKINVNNRTQAACWYQSIAVIDGAKVGTSVPLRRAIKM